MKIEKIFISLIVLFLISSALWAHLEFFKEELQFELDKNYFTVEGDYYFRNAGDHDIKATLFYPIPRDSILSTYDSSFVKGPSRRTESQITVMKENGFFFNVEVGEKDTACYRVSYRQKILGNKASYIFTTTNTWGKPLEEAVFQLTFPNKKLRIDSLSMIPDRLTENDAEYTFFWEKENFMPEKDFVIYFQSSEKRATSADHTNRRKTFLYVRLTPFLIPGVAVGLSRRLYLSDSGFIDFILAGHYHFYQEFQKSAGLSITSEHFGNPNGNGFFYRMNLGAEYGEYANPLDDDPEPDKRWMPNITFGLGYGFYLGNYPSLRISAELGWTAIIGRINIEFLF